MHGERPSPRSSEEVFRGPLFRVEVERWDDPERRRDIVRHLGAVAVLPVTPAGEVVLVRQLREAIREHLLEVPAGVLDVGGEGRDAAARREVMEETGMRVESLHPLHAIQTSPGFVDEPVWLYVAEVSGRPAAPAEEGIEVVTLPYERAAEMVRDGEITDAKTALLLLLAAPLVGERDRRPGPG